jgi:hypothetical protein
MVAVIIKYFYINAGNKVSAGLICAEGNTPCSDGDRNKFKKTFVRKLA